MKKLYFFLFTISFFQIQAQNWCTPGSTWHYSSGSGSVGYTKYMYLYDTLVGTNLCNKISYESHGSCCGGFTFDYFDYIYTFEQNGIVFKNNGTLNSPLYDTLYNFTGTVGTKWRSNPSNGPSCAHSYIEITGSGSMVIQGQTLNWRKIFYKNYYMYPSGWIESGTDTIFERIGTRHQMEFITGSNCADGTDIGPGSFRCFSDNQINLQMSSVACDFTTGVDKIVNTSEGLEVNNPAIDFIHIKIKSYKDKNSKRIVLIDQLGNKVYDQLHSENEFNVSTQNLSAGLYILKVYVDNNLLNKKLLIQN